MPQRPAREEGSCSWSMVLHLLHYDNPIEPGRLLTREAFRFRLAVVNPLNAIGATGAPRSHGLPGAHVVAVLNVIDLTGHRREFNHEGAIGQPYRAVDLDRCSLLLNARGFQYRLGAQLGLECLTVYHIIFNGELSRCFARAQFSVVLDEGHAVHIARSVEHLDALTQTPDRDLDRRQAESRRIGDAHFL